MVSKEPSCLVDLTRIVQVYGSGQNLLDLRFVNTCLLCYAGFWLFDEQVNIRSYYLKMNKLDCLYRKINLRSVEIWVLASYSKNRKRHMSSQVVSNFVFVGIRYSAEYL